MNSTKRGFLKAGAILGIIAAAFSILSGLGMFSVDGVVTEDIIKEIYSTETGYKLTETNEGYTIEFTEDGETVTITSEQIQNVLEIAKVVMIVLGVIIIGVSVAMLVISILILKRLKNRTVHKGLIITLLVLGALMSSLLIVGFMIVALCIKDKVATLENIEEIAKENQNTME